MKAIRSFLTGRLTRNILFWLGLTLIIGVQLSRNNDNHLVNSFFRLAYVIGFGLPVYLHNLWLIPQFLYRKKIGPYSVLLILVWAGGAFFVQLVYRQMEVFFPGDYNDFALASNAYFSQLVHLGGLMILFAMGKFSADSFNRQQKLEKLEKEKLQSELENLRNQIDPHFLFNALNTIFSLSREMSPLTPNAVSDLSSILRYVIYDSQVDLMPLTDELDFIRNYIDFMSLRTESDIDIQLSVSVESNDYKIPPLLMLPLIENAFKHGVHEIAGKAYLHISILLENGELQFICKNSKPEKERGANAGIGLENIRKRLHLIYGERASLTVFHNKYDYESRLNIEV